VHSVSEATSGVAPLREAILGWIRTHATPQRRAGTRADAGGGERARRIPNRVALRSYISHPGVTR
jgi:hypothetical protein